MAEHDSTPGAGSKNYALSDADGPRHDPTLPSPRILSTDGPLHLVAYLIEDGVRVIGPVARDGAVVYDDLETPEDLARGYQVEAGPGTYRARQSGTAFFDHVLGPTPWKRFLHPPRETLHRTRVNGSDIVIESAPMLEERLAFVGVRACDLAAIGVLDRVMMGGTHPDPRYSARRKATLIIAANCRVSADTCFCASMGTGPRVDAGYDIALNELGTGPESRFLAEAGSAAGADLLARFVSVEASSGDLEAADHGAVQAAAQQVRTLDPVGLPEAIRGSAEHPQWDDVATRCLNCTNCTMVCPTCFCTTTEEVSDLAGTRSERQQRWDSCFTLDFSYVHGGSVRPSAKSRYRQWLTHKLGTWPEQFETLGCTGCGRCIAWCPVGIDLTEEAGILRKATP